MTAEPTLHIKTLGGLSIELNGRPITTFVSAKAEALLVYLVCNPRQHPRETLADLLWDDRTQRQAMSNLRTVLYSLRKEVGVFVTITRKTAAINPESNLSIDALKLETAVPQTGIQSEADAQKAEQALTLYNGDFLAGFFLPEAAEFESWVAAQRENLHRQFVDASVQLGRYHLDQQHYANAINTATRLLQIDSLAEAGHRQLMEALARNNQRAEALAQYEKCRYILESELGLEPEIETLSLCNAIRSDSLMPLEHAIDAEVEKTYETPRPNLPLQQAPILGREKELAELQQLLTNSTRLVTIVGPGGMGKTRLALETAHNLFNQFEDGAAFVNLTSLSAPDAVVPAIAKAIYYDFLEQSESNQTKELLNYLSRKKLLVVMDNFEHLLDAAPLLSEIIEKAPNLKLLVTSRERLKLQVEHVFSLDGFRLTDWQAVNEAKEDPAVALFLQQALRIRPSFTLRTEHLQPLQKIFQLLGGMPLAIILAAGWIEVLSPAEILSEIGRNIDLLEANMRDIPDRHRSIRAVFDGTWNRLDGREQKIFAALSIFQGGFDLEAAKAVTGVTPRNLITLIDRSLLAKKENGRFQIHELLRQYGFRVLHRSSELEKKARQNHSVYFCKFLEQREKNLKGHQSQEAEKEIADDFENVLIAWKWASDNSPEHIFQSQRTLGIFIGRQERGKIGRDAFAYALSSMGSTTTEHPKEFAEFLAWNSMLTFGIDKDEAKNILRKAVIYINAAQKKGQDIRAEKAFILKAQAFGPSVDFNSQIEYLLKSCSIYEELGLLWDLAWVYIDLGHVYHYQTDYSLADSYYEKGVELFNNLGDYDFAYHQSVFMAANKAWSGKLIETESIYTEIRNYSQNHSNRVLKFYSYQGLGMVFLFSGRFQDALVNIAKSQTINQDAHVKFSTWIICWSLLHLSRYEEMQNQIHSTYNISLRNDQIPDYYIGIANFLKANQALVMNNLENAMEHFNESWKIFNTLEFFDERGWIQAGLTILACQQRNLKEARQYLIEILELNLFLPNIQALPAAALLMAELGNTERAIELHAHALTHPFIANSQWFRDVALDKLDALAASLPPETVVVAHERGRSRDLWQTAESLLAELKGQAL